MLINTEVFLIKAKELVFAQSGDDAVKTGVGITD